jgi:site-specific DNA recombinase
MVVVYKIDRLSRSLWVFAKMVGRFDEHDVTFVSVTQQLNTTILPERMMRAVHVWRNDDPAQYTI